MASGHICLNLSSKVLWEDFPSFADQLIRQFDGVQIEKAEAPDIRIWKLKIRDAEVRLVFDDYPLMVSLEALDNNGDKVLEYLHNALANIKDKAVS